MISSRWVKRALVLSGALLLVAAVAVTYIWYAPRRTPAGQPALVTLAAGDLSPFERAFDAGAGATRVLVMLSPT